MSIVAELVGEHGTHLLVGQALQQRETDQQDTTAWQETKKPPPFDDGRVRDGGDPDLIGQPRTDGVRQFGERAPQPGRVIPEERNPLRYEWLRLEPQQRSDTHADQQAERETSEKEQRDVVDGAQQQASAEGQQHEPRGHQRVEPQQDEQGEHGPDHGVPRTHGGHSTHSPRPKWPKP